MASHQGCYRNSLALAAWHHARSIAFPNISTGIYRFPKPLTADIAIETVKAYLMAGHQGIERVYFVCFDEENYGIYKERLAGR
ncbi:macro domain-containing protein [Paenibacillus sp. RC84]|uniref:macro domain-containing protein n=1 Tax=Paenibacillus sp. RC84 TaxID=3156252 RepID=UPI0035199657